MEKRRIWPAVLITAIITTILTSIIFGSLTLASILNLGSDNTKLRNIWSIIDKTYYQDVDYDEAMQMAEDYACAGMMYSLNDPYSEYYTAEDYAALQESLSGTYYGVGITIAYDTETDYVTVVANPFYGSPAASAGILKGDQLIQVDDLLITGDSMNDAVTYMRTPKEDASPLHITWLRDGKEMSADITPSDVVMNSVNVAQYEDITYIQLTGFDEQTTPLFEEALSSIDRSKTKGLVLDLRDNPGGVMSTAVEICDMLLPKGTVVYTQDKSGDKEEYKSDQQYFDIPMVVLINSGSASASEIVAGALKDFDRATIIGETSYGKGVVQGIYPLGDGSAVKLTVSRYYTPSGICIDGTGIEPDETVLLPEGTTSFDPLEFDLAVDTQMNRAIEILHKTK